MRIIKSICDLTVIEVSFYLKMKKINLKNLIQKHLE